MTSPTTPAHGTRWSYVKGCRCPECAEASRKYIREYQRRVRGTKKPRVGEFDPYQLKLIKE